MYLEKFMREVSQEDQKQAAIPPGKRQLLPWSTNAQAAFDVLVELLLGDDWYTMCSMGIEQENTEALYEILLRKSRKFRAFDRARRKGKAK